MTIKEKYPKWKALVQIPSVGNFIDLLDVEDIKTVSYDTYMVMSLEAAFIYTKEHGRIFMVEENRNKHDSLLPDEVRNYILDNQTVDPNLPD